MQTRKRQEIDRRDTELENIVGNLLIAEYQVEKLRGRLMEKLTPAYSGTNAVNSSAYSFKIGGKWYKLSLKVEEETELNIKKEKEA
ncbi:MAG: hypothetical protein QXJ74_02660 [Nitrososphaera sp.]|uniref:hypothetical protein n=1 Tax=Nitrososphaera sp. TaxID=1971748 RepID=UPI001831C793|nr:hypothetical protein [Nitrososphaera sp.]NWG36285.1 hypothetical protein [Nitrososphaera sp.]